MIFNRLTLAQDARFEGLGLHSGVPVTMTVRPGERGIIFHHNGSSVNAHPENVTDTTRSTRLGEIGTVEHIMSALAGLEITDAEIELTAPEIPGMDGSSTLFVHGLQSAGTQTIGTQELPDLYSRIYHQEPDLKIALGKGNGHWRYEFETGERWPGSQHYETQAVIEDYPTEIAPARTTAFNEEIPMVIKAGLAKGLDKDSALILGDNGYMNEARFEDEPARHKLLDMIGDLYLSGVPIRFLNVVGSKNGHRANIIMAKMLRKAVFGDQ